MARFTSFIPLNSGRPCWPSTFRRSPPFKRPHTCDLTPGVSSLTRQPSEWELDAIAPVANRLAEHLGKLPTGKLFAIRNLPDGNLEIELVSGPTRPGGGKPKPIEVPEQISRYHQAARSFRDEKDHHEVSRELVQRATRIIHVLSREATARGWEVRAARRSPDAYGRESWTPSKDGHLVIETEDERFWFRLREGKVRLRGHWEQEVEHHRNVDPDSPWWRDREIPRGPYDANADGKLELELFCGKRYAYGDRQREAAAEAERRAKEEARQREVDFKVHLKEAWRRLFEARRAKELRSHASAWSEARTLSAHCDAVEAAHGDDPEARRWLEWARGFIEKLDPLGKPPSLPEITEAPEDELQQYMPDGWSVQGAEYPDPRKASGRFAGRR